MLISPTILFYILAKLFVTSKAGVPLELARLALAISTAARCLQFLLWLYIRLKLFLSSKWGGLSGLPRLAARSQYFAACVTAADCLQFLLWPYILLKRFLAK